MGKACFLTGFRHRSTIGANEAGESKTRQCSCLLFCVFLFVGSNRERHCLETTFWMQQRYTLWMQQNDRGRGLYTEIETKIARKQYKDTVERSRPTRARCKKALRSRAGTPRRRKTYLTVFRGIEPCKENKDPWISFC